MNKVMSKLHKIILKMLSTEGVLAILFVVSVVVISGDIPFWSDLCFIYISGLAGAGIWVFSEHAHRHRR